MQPRRQFDRGRPAAQTEEAAWGRKHRPDYGLIILMLLMIAIGLIVVYSISPALSKAANVSPNHYVNKQMIAIALSVVAFIFTAKVPLATWKRLYKPLLIIAGIVTFITLVTPTNPAYPAHRWIHMGSFSFQSVELLKFAVLIWLAGMLGERIRQGTIADTQETLKPLAIAIVVLAIVVAGIQSDLGSMGVLVAMMGMMAFVAGLPLKKIGIILVVIGLIGALAVSSTPYRRDRLATYMNPGKDCQAAGYQACQALIAVGSGGMTGLGLGRSVQAYGYLPEAANDSIFAIYAEKFGFIGSIALLGILAAFFGRIKSIAERAPDHFSRLLVIGILAWLSIQAMINIGAMIGLLPLKGITLPLISYGGTSVVFVAAAVGLVFQVSYYTAHHTPRITDNKKGTTHDDSSDRRRLRGAYHPNPGSRARA